MDASLEADSFSFNFDKTRWGRRGSTTINKNFRKLKALAYFYLFIYLNKTHAYPESTITFIY